MIFGVTREVVILIPLLSKHKRIYFLDISKLLVSHSITNIVKRLNIVWIILAAIVIILFLTGCGGDVQVLNTDGNTIGSTTEQSPKFTKISNTPFSQVPQTTNQVSVGKFDCLVTTTPGKKVSPDFGVAYGKGPVYAVFPHELGVPNNPTYYGDGVEINGKKAMKVLWISDNSYNGLISVTGHQLDGTNKLEFSIDNKITTQMQFDTGNKGSTSQDWPFWPILTLIPAPGCYAYEISGQNFNYSIIFLALNQKPPVH